MSLCSHIPSHLCLQGNFLSLLWAELCPSQNSYVEVFTPSTSEIVTTFGDRVFQEEIKIRWGHTGGPYPNMTIVIREIRTQTCTGEDRRWPSTSEREEPPKIPNLDFRLLSLQNYEKINFHCLSHLVCGICMAALANQYRHNSIFLGVLYNGIIQYVYLASFAWIQPRCFQDSSLLCVSIDDSII